MLEAPRELLARALLPLYPLDPPLKPLDRDPLGMLRLPIDSPPRLPEVPAAERSLTPAPPRFPEVPAAERSLTPAPPAARLLTPAAERSLAPAPPAARLLAPAPEPAGCPRLEPPNFSAVRWSP
jgi:hypothetical protein